MVNDTTAEIFLYGFIDQYDCSASDFVKELRSLDKACNTINVRINSGGGNVFEGIAIYNAIKQCKANVNTYIDGLAASMGSIIAIAGSKVYMSKMAQIMTHQPSTGSWGTSQDMRKNADLLDGIEKTMSAIYSSKTGKTADDCKAAFMNGKDNWFNAEQALECKLADELYDAEGIEAPVQKTDAKMVWDNYQHQIAAKLIQQNENMKQTFLSPAAMAALQIGDNTDEATVNAKISDLVAKAGQVDAANAAKTKAENELAEFKAKATEADIKALLDAAVADKKMTVEMRNAFEQQFKGNLEGLKAVVATLKPYEAKTKPEEDNKESVLTVMGKKTYSELDRSGELPALKALSLDVFKAKYKDHFGTEYTGK